MKKTTMKAVRMLAGSVIFYALFSRFRSDRARGPSSVISWSVLSWSVLAS
jgi:hypothetical protein